MDAVSIALGKGLSGDKGRGCDYGLSVRAGHHSRFQEAFLTATFVADRAREVVIELLLGLCFGGYYVHLALEQGANGLGVHGLEHT